MGFGDLSDGDFRYECCFHRLCQLQFILKLFLEVWGDAGSCRAEQRKKDVGTGTHLKRTESLSLSLSTESKAVWSKGLASPFIKIPMVEPATPASLILSLCILSTMSHPAVPRLPGSFA